MRGFGFLLVVIFVIAAIVGIIYVSALFLFLLLAAVIVLVIGLVSPDKLSPDEAAWRKKKQKEGALELVFPFAGLGAVIGAIVGFFKGCNVTDMTFDFGVWFLTVIVFAIIGAIIGGFLGYVFGD